MYERLGRKLKSLAKAIVIFDWIVGIIAGLFLIFFLEMVLAGLLVVVLCPILGWVSSWIVYAIGDIYDKVSVLYLGYLKSPTRPASGEQNK